MGDDMFAQFHISVHEATVTGSVIYLDHFNLTGGGGLTPRCMIGNVTNRVRLDVGVRLYRTDLSKDGSYRRVSWIFSIMSLRSE